MQEPGPHDIFWDGRDDAGQRVASGLYLIRVEERASGHFVAQRLAVLR